MLQFFCQKRHTGESRVVGELRRLQPGARKTKFLCLVPMCTQQLHLEKQTDEEPQIPALIQDSHLTKVRHWSQEKSAENDGCAGMCPTPLQGKQCTHSSTNNEYHCHIYEGQQSIVIMVVLILVVFQTPRGTGTSDTLEEELCWLQKWHKSRLGQADIDSLWICRWVTLSIARPASPPLRCA